MVNFVSEDHQDFVMKKAKEIGSKYYEDIKQNVEIMMKQGSEIAKVRPASIKSFESDEYFGAIATEYFPNNSEKKS